KVCRCYRNSPMPCANGVLDTKWRTSKKMMYLLLTLLLFTQGTAQDLYDRAVKLYQGVDGPKDPYKAAELLQTAAEQGNADAQFMLAVLYVTGDGVPEQVAKAAEWYTKAAEQGHVEAQFNIGVLYVNGIGVRLDFAKAGEWFSKAA